MTRAIPPLDIIGDSLLTSSSISEPDTGEAPWNAGTAYVVGDEAYYTDHIIYTRLVDGTTATTPDLDTTNWEPTRYTNKYAMFDMYRNTQSTDASPIEVVLTPGERVNTLVVAGMTNVNTLEVVVTSGGTEVYNYVEDLDTREVVDWYGYFFEPFSTRSEVVLLTIPPYSNAVITVTLTATSGSPSVGYMAIGNNVFMGYAQYGATSRAINLSTFTRNANTGTVEMIPKRNIPIVDVRIFATKSLSAILYNLRDAAAGMSLIWTGIDDSSDYFFKPLFAIGAYKNFEINVEHQSHTIVNLSIEEI